MSSRFGTRTVLSCMKNEGIFLLEWVAYYRLLGADHIVVLTNDCADGTDLMLDRLQELGHVTHLRNNDYGRESPQIHGLARVREELDIVGQADWLLHVDSDEFLNIIHGQNRLDDLIEVAQGFDACAIAWRPFGDNGHQSWPGGNVIEAFTACDKKPFWSTAFHKALFQPRKFQAITVHMPKHPYRPDARQCNAQGDEIDPAALYNMLHERHRGMDREKLTWDGACVNHYTVKSQDIFLLKNDRGDGADRGGTKRYLNSTFHRRYNTNRREDRSILRHLPELQDRLAELRADPLLATLERASNLWWDNRRARVLTPERIAEWTLPTETEETAA
ncbi:glycosyltransferase family 2 protein [Nioella sp.]|uniref:glycosyltransferase family 2 protein n=1 Tax=Nioella sp. TaxID=1912091 RepID=UPI0035115E65